MKIPFWLVIILSCIIGGIVGLYLDYKGLHPLQPLLDKIKHKDYQYEIRK